MTSCELCGKTPTLDDKPLESHHITWQKDFDERGIADAKPHLKKNHASNILVLCSECHDSIDAGDIEVTGVVNTTRGRRVVVA